MPPPHTSHEYTRAPGLATVACAGRCLYKYTQYIYVYTRAHTHTQTHKHTHTHTHTPAEPAVGTSWALANHWRIRGEIFFRDFLKKIGIFLKKKCLKKTPQKNHFFGGFFSVLKKPPKKNDVHVGHVCQKCLSQFF